MLRSLLVYISPHEYALRDKPTCPERLFQQDTHSAATSSWSQSFEGNQYRANGHLYVLTMMIFKWATLEAAYDRRYGMAGATPQPPHCYQEIGKPEECMTC